MTRTKNPKIQKLIYSGDRDRIRAAAKKGARATALKRAKARQMVEDAQDFAEAVNAIYAERNATQRALEFFESQRQANEHIIPID